ncbi:pcf11 cleavage and polyadenylation factor subunit isoform X1 [Ptiloglossa arizonensis]|uniref:pcf11 cleavage and polyadenylation factor subunit isoform X1 n=1 Tax=Ptiloglossa arizonensis TaxID=3350558 RepID=UPI003FA142A9
MMSTKSKEIADEYISSLSDLTINSKPLINMLTMLAEDNIEHAPAIVQAVENHLQKVRSDIKLPVLYLIDSIVKNVNGAYLNLFTQNIVNTFCGVFEKVDENTRASMWKLRQTWNDVFPSKKLFSLDVRVQSIDPAWPITASPTSVSSGSIHVNPRFFSMPQQSATSIVAQPIVAPVKLPPGDPVTPTEAVMREQLLKKQRELIELQKKKIELELLQAKANLEQQQRQLDKQAGNLKAELVAATTHVTSGMETITQVKPVALNVPCQASKPVTKQFPAATASLLKNAGTNNGPRIAPASSIAVASAKPVSRDPRLKTTSTQDVPVSSMDPRQRISTPSQKDTRGEGQTQLAANTNTVLSDQLKQQLLSKQAVTSTINKSPTNLAGSDTATINASNNNNANTNLNNNNNNKNFSGNANKDAVSHRTSQKKDPRLSSNSSGNLNSNSSKGSQSLSVGSNSSLTLSASNRGGGSNDSKSKDSKSSNSRSFSSSTIDKSSTSSKSSHRKIGNKSRSKQPQTSPNKIPKVDRDVSPVRSKSREKDSGDSSPSSRTSPQSFQTSKNRKKNMKSRKRSPSPPYRIPRRNDTKSNSSLSSSGGVTEEEQSGSLIVSPPHPPTFKEIRPNARQRNYVRRNKDGSLSPERSPANAGNAQTSVEPTLESSSKDEDLRATLPLPGATASVPEKKEDLDLRVLPPPVNTNKRQSSEHMESSLLKKSKAEKFDALFGNEDVDLRTLTHPKAGRPPTPPPPVISGEDGKDGWAKLKTPSKNDREKQTNNTDDKRDSRDRNRDRLGRLRLYNKLPDDPKERRRTLSNEDQDNRPGRRGRENDKPERNEDRNIEIIMKQAAEQLNQGSITKTQYNTLIQEVLHMSEDRKLRAAQRKEKEVGSIVWEKGVNLDMAGPGDRAPTFSPSSDKEVMRNKDHPIPRNPNGPRWQSQPWQQPGPWAHPPGPPYGPQGHFSTDFRPVGPWQNPRHFGPIRPDYQYHGGFNHNLGPNPRLGPGIMGPMGPNGPLMSNLLPNGPIGPMGMPNPPISLPGMMMNNGPISNLMSNPNMPPLSAARNVSPNSSSKYDLEDGDQNYSTTMMKNQNPHSRELPPPDPKLLDEIARDTMKSINIDNIPREIRYYGQTGVVFMNWDDPREIGFQDGIRRILIDDKDTITCAFNDQYKEFMYEGEVHRIKLGAPTRELYVDDRWYECYFGGMPVTIDLGGKKVSVKLEGPPPQVKIGTVKRTDLVVAKINLIINARNMVPVFLDAKPQIFEIEGKPHTLEFIDSLQTVLLNGRPFKVEFGGLPKPIIVRDKKHFIRFSVLPRGVRPGYVKIAGMRGEEPIEAPPTPPLLTQKPKVDTTSAPTQFSSVEPESTSQDGSDLRSTPKPDLQLDMLSSVLPSAMAPASGLSYQAEPAENPPPAAPALSLPLNMNELFQRLVETGIVPNLSEQKKQEEEEKKEPEIIPVSFDKPETLKVKQPAIAAALYSGMQCSSCGARFAPELATRYSHHLDWHFRQNRRERDSARKAHSRPWYYDVSDWIQFEEIEDLEDRAQSWFETEKQTADTEGIATEDSPQEALQPSVPTGSDEDSRCQVCHDAFEQFYNEEKEEWHLRPAINFEGKNYHPLCLDDYKEKSLVRALEKSALALEETIEEMEDEKKESTDETFTEENKTEELTVEGLNLEIETIEASDEIVKDDVQEETSTIENKEENTMVVDNADTEQNDKEEEEEEEIENNIEETIDTENLEKLVAPAISEAEACETENVDKSFENIKIKEEPIDEPEEQLEEEQFDFTNILVKEEPVEPEPDPEESIITEPATADTTYAAVKSSIDGNVELDSTPAAIPAAPSRIKINITKPLCINKEPEESKEKPVAEIPAEEVAEPLVPASIKPALQGRKLSNLPPVERGQELSGLCSIM